MCYYNLVFCQAEIVAKQLSKTFSAYWYCLGYICETLKIEISKTINQNILF